MYSFILMASMAAGGEAPAGFWAPGGGCHGRLALVEVQRTHLRLARVHETAPKAGCHGVTPANLPLPMPPAPPPAAPTAPVAPNKAPTPVSAVAAPAPVVNVVGFARRVTRAAVCPFGGCGR